jgi:DNA-binding XRE family transcriptional regulator
MNNRLRDLRDKHAWSQAIWRQLDVSRQTVQADRDASDPALPLAFRIARRSVNH